MTDSQNCLNIGSFGLNYFNYLYFRPYIFVILYFSTISLYPHNPKYVSSVSHSFLFVFHTYGFIVFTVISCFKKTENILLITKKGK